MENNCKDCLQVKNLDGRLTKIEKSLDHKGDNFEERITKLERKSDVSIEKTKMIFSILEEIKDSIKDISLKIGAIEKKPSETVNKILVAVTSSVITAIVFAGLKHLN